MTVGQTYRLGQVAKMVGCSTYKLRRLCEAGQIEAELTGKGQWRIPIDECSRLERDGLPPMPASPPSDAEEPSVEAGLESNPEPQLFEPESNVVREELDGVQIAEARLKRRRIELEQEDVEEAFRERVRKRLEPMLAAERRRAEAEEVARHRTWREQWLNRAANLIPRSCSPALYLRVNLAVQELLERLHQASSDTHVDRLVKTAVEEALQPHYRQQAVDQAITAALNTLPAGAIWEDAWKAEATIAARKGIAAVGTGAAAWELAAAAKQAIVPVAQRYVDQQARQALIREMAGWRIFDAKSDEREAATEALKDALAGLAPGSGPTALKLLRDRTIAPFEQRVDDRKRRSREREEATEAAESALSHVGRYLAAEYEFDSWTERFETERELKAQLLPMLTRRFLNGHLEDHEGAQEAIAEFIDDWLCDDD